MIKSGASPSAARAAKAHTGALVGEDRVFDAVLQECGVIRVTSVEAFVDVALMLADVFPGRMPHGSGVGSSRSAAATACWPRTRRRNMD